MHLAAVGNEALPNGHLGASPASVKPHVTGLPLAENMSLSLWLQTVRHDPLLDTRTTPELPKEADVVVIGSGIGGTLTALSLLTSPDPPKSVLLLEAREFCSGATGRNAGHCKPDIWRGYRDYKKLWGKEQAMKVGVLCITRGRTEGQILRNERRTWEAVVQYVKENQIDCELWVGKTLDVMMSPDVAKRAAEVYDEFVADGGDPRDIGVYTDPAKAEEVSRLKGAQAAYSSPASTLHPWKFTAYIARKALALGLNLQTWTPVTQVSGSAHQWTVHTDRGDVATPKVVHMTNAYAGALLPEFAGVVIPTPHMCNKVQPPSEFSGSKSLENSYAVCFPNGMFSVNPRQGGDGSVLFGGGNPAVPKLRAYVAEDPENRTLDDGLINFEPVTDAVRKLGSESLQWDKTTRGSRVRYEYAWSGIIGTSADSQPFMGAVPGNPGQFMCCGHNGHGMARIFTTSPALAKIIQGARYADTGLPDIWEVTQERLDKVKAPGWERPEKHMSFKILQTA